MKQEQLLRRKLDLLLRTGKMLLESAADTNRVVRNMKRTAAYLGLPEENLHIKVDYTMIVVNLSDDAHSFSKFQKCEQHGINMTTISAVSKLTWSAIREDYSLDKFEECLEEIRLRKRNYKPMLVALCAGLACGGFCKLFGCDWVAFFYASMCAFLGFRLRHYCMQFGMNVYMSVAIAACGATILAYGAHYLPLTETPWHPMLACALFIVPGVPLINFVDDMIDNYIHVGLIRAANTFMILVAMAFGISFVIKLFNVETMFPTIRLNPGDNYWISALAAGISAVGFSMIFNIPRRLLWVVAVGGALAVCTRNFINIDLGAGPVIGSFSGALIVSLVAIKAVHWFHAPNHILTIPCVIPMIPGVLMYRFILGLMNLNVEELNDAIPLFAALHCGVVSAMIILGISVGVALPNILMRRYIAADRRRELKQLIQERRERGAFVEFE